MLPSFAKFLTEELTPDQKEVVDHWAKGSSAAEMISHHVIPSGQHRMVIPLDDPHDEAEEHVEAPTHIKQHLENAGYKIKNYKAGVVEDKHGRETKIGKALTASKAPKEYIDHVNADPARTGAKKVHSNLEVVVSRHPYDVAGMSTNRGWTSCMNMGKPDPVLKDTPVYHEPTAMVGHGSNSHKLPDELKHGTHVAYLVNKGDHEIKNPIARIALKPYHSADEEHTILRPEGTTYGSPASSFEHTVNKWVNHHFPMKDEHEAYYKHDSVYSDSAPEKLVNHNKLIKEPQRIRDIHPDDLGETAWELKKAGLMNQQHLDNFWAHPHNEGKRIAIAYGGEKEHIKALDPRYHGEHDFHVAHHVKTVKAAEHLARTTNNPYAVEHIFLNHEGSIAKPVAEIAAKRIKKEKLADDSHVGFSWKNTAKTAIENYPHIGKTLKGVSNDIDERIARHTEDVDMLKDFTKHPNINVRVSAYGNRHLPKSEHIAALKNKDERDSIHNEASVMLAHDNLTHHLPEMSNNARSWVAASTHNKETIDALAYDNHPDIVATIADRGFHLDRLSHHPDERIQTIARHRLLTRLGTGATIPNHWATSGALHDPKNVGKTYGQIINPST